MTIESQALEDAKSPLTTSGSAEEPVLLPA